MHDHDHDDPHDVGHEHGHDHPHQHAAASTGLLLDIGGDVGAVVVLLATAEPGEEIEMQPVGRPDGRFHTGIHRRPFDGVDVWSAVFPEVREGSYELLDRDGQPMVPVAVTGGAVATLDLR